MYHRNKTIISFLVLVSLLVLVSGCSKRFIVTTPMEMPIETGRKCAIGTITDELPLDFDASSKPKEEDIEKLKMFLVAEINKKDALNAFLSLGNSKYIIDGSILDFKKGSGLVRAFIGFGIGDAKITTNLRLRDRETGEILFGGNFTSRVSDYKISGEEIFKQVAKDFSNQLHIELKTMGVEVRKRFDATKFEIK